MASSECTVQMTNACLPVPLLAVLDAHLAVLNKHLTLGQGSQRICYTIEHAEPSLALFLLSSSVWPSHLSEWQCTGEDSFVGGRVNW